MTDELQCLIEQLLEAQWQAAMQYALTIDMEVTHYGGDSSVTEELWDTYSAYVEDRHEAYHQIIEEVERISKHG